LSYAVTGKILTRLIKTQVYFREEEFTALHAAAARRGCSISQLVREAVIKIILKPQAERPVAIWAGKPRRTSVEHDSVHDDI
jgi:hypothetical protein